MTSPAHKIRIGNLTATIWRNTGDNGTWYSVQPKRSYKTGDDEWRETDALGVDDLLPMAKLLDQAHTWITDQMAADRKARKNAEKEAA
jgi:hypothetical protein